MQMPNNHLNGSIQDVFFRILAPHIQDLERHTDGVSASAISGRIDISNVCLKKSILDTFELPVEVVEGHVGSLSLYNKLGQTHLQLKELILKLIPNFNVHHIRDRDASAKLRLTSRLKTMESFDNVEIDYLLSGFFISLISQFRENICTTIQNAHVYLEDAMTLSDTIITGITFQELSAISSTVPTERSAESLRKVEQSVTIKALALYLNKSVDFSNLPPKIPSTYGFSSLDLLNANIPGQYFIIQPVDINIQVLITPVPNSIIMDIQIYLDSCQLHLHQYQYNYIMTFTERYCLFIGKRKHRRYWPRRCKDSHGKFWFAAMTILNKLRATRSFSSERLKVFCQQRRQYLSLFTKQIRNTLTSDDAKTLQELEQSLHLSDIYLFRRLAWQHAHSTNSHLFGHSDIGMSQGVQILFHANIEKVSITFHLQNGSHDVHLYSLLMESVKVMAEQGSDVVDLNVSLGSFAIFDEGLGSFSYNPLAKFGTIVRPSSELVPSDATGPECLVLILKRQFLADRPKSSITLNTGPVDIVYDRSPVESFYRFLNVSEKDAAFHEILLGALFCGQVLQINTVWEYNIKIDGISVTFPEDIESSEAPLLFLTSPALHLHGEYERLLSCPPVPNHSDTDINLSPAYDPLIVSLDCAELILFNHREDYHQYLKLVDPQATLVLIQPVDLSILLEIFKYPSSYAVNRPFCRLLLNLPELSYAITDTTYKTMARIIRRCIPYFERLHAGSSGDSPQLEFDVIPLDFLEEVENIPAESPEESTRIRMGEDTVDILLGDVPLIPEEPEQTSVKIFLALDIKIDMFHVSLAKSVNEADAETLGVMHAQDVHFLCSVQKGKYVVDTDIGIIKMEFADPKTSSVSLLPTDGQEETNLMKILFTKIKPTHPEFVLKYEGYDQDVRISLSPSVFHGPMDPVISVWSFLMTTFAPEGNKTDAELESDELEPGDIRLVTSKPNRVRVGMNLTKVQVLLDLDKNTPYQLKNL